MMPSQAAATPRRRSAALTSAHHGGPGLGDHGLEDPAPAVVVGRERLVVVARAAYVGIERRGRPGPDPTAVNVSTW